MASARHLKGTGDDLWRHTSDKVVRVGARVGLTVQNAELFTLTYGALVVQLIKDYEDYEEVNKQLEKMCGAAVEQRSDTRGYNIGTRLIEDFLARSNLPRCTDMREVAEVISKVRVRLPAPPLTAGRLQDVPQHHSDRCLRDAGRSAGGRARA